MSSTPVQDPAAQRLSSGSGQTLPFRPLQPTSDPSASKRVCFYKSGDYKFSGHRMVINTRTFKTFDALLDALSKKVPLPFGVRTITTPRGTHLVRGLDDLQDGGSYVCSDQRRVKPLNVDEVNRRQVPWNTTRPPSASRRKQRVAVRTPKKLVVIKNRDPTVKRTIVLQRRTAPTFDSLLDYLSQILQFPVLKLYSTDGRRVDGLAALILCSGFVVAAGNEPFRLGNNSFHGTGQIAQSFSSGRGSRNFSSSSERYIVNQINKSRNGSRNSHLQHHHGSEVNQHYTSMDTCASGRGDHEYTCIVPQDDDIEKSFRVNQDGSMTVEMKVHLTIKEEEMLHWTTTLSRSSLSKRTACASISESGNSSPDSNNAVAKDSSSIADETKEENHPTRVGTGVGFNNEQVYEGYTSTALGKAKSHFKRAPTPGPRRVKKKTSVESVKMVTESGIQESTLGHYSYMERTADGETTTEGYCIVRHSNSSSSNRPIPKPRKTASADANKKGSTTSILSSGVAEVLQIQNHGMEVTETVMHIYEGQGCYDNYFANEDYNTDGGPVAAPDSKPSTESGPRSSSNDCDIDFSCQPSTADSLQRQREEILSLSSEPISPTRETVMEDKVPTTEKRNEIFKPDGNAKGSPSTCSLDKKLSPSRNSKHSSTDKISNVTMGKKSLSSSESAKSGQNSKEAERKAGNPQSKKSLKASRKDSALLVSNSTENMKKTPPKRQSVNKLATTDNSHNVNTPTRRPQVKKNMSEILQTKKSLLPGKKTISTPKSMIENRIASPKKPLELSESVSMPSLNLTPSQIHQYVENWLENVSPDQASYTESIPDELEPRPKVVFKIGDDSESDETNECQSKLDECYTLSGVVKKSVSCLSVPLSHEGTETTVLYNEQKPRGLCVSMPSVRVDSVHQGNALRPHKSAEAIGPEESESTPSISNILSPKAKIKPVLRQLCSSIQCIRSVSDANTTSNLEKSNSLPDFSTQVASVFGSSCKAFLSFLSVMTLRDSITGSAVGDGNQSQSTSEAMLMMESLQKISVIEDEEEQRSSLTDLQSRASSEFRERWKDFQIMRERFESEPLSPKVSETEFALDVVSEGGDVFEGQIDELLEELHMPQDLKAEISSTIHQARNFYPVDESTFIETDRNQSDSEEDVEKFVDEHNDDTKQSQGPVSSNIVQDVKEKKQDDDSGDDLNKMQSMYSEQEKIRELAQEADEVQETGIDVQSSDAQTEREEALEIKDESEGKDDQLEEVEQNREEERDEERNLINYYGEENIGNEMEEENEDMAEKEDDEGQEKWEAGKESGCESVVKVEEGTEGEMTTDEEKLEREKEGVEETEEGTMETQDAEKGGETDEREMAEEEEEVNEDAAGEEENGEEGSKKRKKDETQEEADENIEEQVEEEKEEIVPENSSEEKIEEGIEEEEKVDKTAGEDEKEVGMITDNDNKEGPEDVIEETEEEKDLENIADEMEEKEVKSSVEDEGNGDSEESDDFNGEVVEKEEEVNVLIENDVEEEEEIIGDADDENEEENNCDELEEKQEEEKEVDTEKDIEGEVEEVIGDTDEEEGVENMIDEVEESEGEVDVATKKDEEEEVEEVTDEIQGEEKVGGEINGEMEEKEEQEVDLAFENDAEEDIEGEEEETINHKGEDTDDNIDVVSGEDEEAEEIINETDEEEENINEDGEEEIIGEDCNEEESEDSDAEVKNAEEGRSSVTTNKDEEEAEGETDKEEENNEESRKEFEKQSSLEVEEIEESETGENTRDGLTLDEEDREDDEENEQDEELEQMEQQESNYDIIEEDDVTEDMDSSDNDADSKNLVQHCSSHEETNTGHITDSPTKYSSEGQCEYEKDNETDTVDELEIDGGGQTHEDRSNSLPHPVEISQELLDFVNSALQSSSLTFTYDARGNIRIEPDNAQVVQTKLTVIPNHRKDSSYGLKRLPSPSTSDLTDYRPETSESGGYKSQDSLDIVTESGEEASAKPFPVCRRKVDIPDGKMDVERAVSKVSVASNSEILQNSGLKSGESFSSYDSGSKVSREDLSYFSATSSSKADGEAAQCMSLTPGKEEIDGVLIDQGRWLLKENHLIRKSPPVSLGMYGNLDSTSIDTGQEESPPHYKTKKNPLVAISSSELEEMVKPQTPKCTYYNMPHGSDSDPFLDESSIQNGKKETSFVKGRGFRVSPTIDTSKTWSNKNGSLSSFASVELKMPDSRVHPVGESSAVTQARRTPSGGQRALQAQDSLDTLRARQLLVKYFWLKKYIPTFNKPCFVNAKQNTCSVLFKSQQGTPLIISAEGDSLQIPIFQKFYISFTVYIFARKNLKNLTINIEKVMS
uniref:Doublecortin domain-containing protein n=1 Tax=Echeneis naucrates TaxID=173247 RepID=A0A665WPN3_ECHNA